MLVSSEKSEEPSANKKINWRRELLFWTTILANLITILFFVYRLFKNGF